MRLVEPSAAIETPLLPYAVQHLWSILIVRPLLGKRAIAVLCPLLHAQCATVRTLSRFASSDAESSHGPVR